MLKPKDLRKIARSRLTDARALLRSRRYDGAVYLCGYGIELALNARICKTLHWPGFPATRKEFEGLISFKIHDLDMLLRLSGIETKIRTRFLTDWSVVVQWYASGEPHLQNGSTTCDHVRGTVLPHSPELGASDPRQMVRRADDRGGRAHAMAPSPSRWKTGPGLRGAQFFAAPPASRSAFHRSGSSSSSRLAGWVLIRSRTSRR